MSNELKTCECGKEFTEEQSSGDLCFKCKVDGVRFSFRGVAGWGREQFNKHTVRSYVADADRAIEASGGSTADYEFTGNRWV